MRLRATDSGGLSTFGDVRVLTVAGTNQAPAVDKPLQDLPWTEGQAFQITVATTTFIDPNGNSLTYSASLASGASLPAWLSFNSFTRIFSGTPPAGSPDYNVRVTATDSGGLSAFDDVMFFTVPATGQVNPGNDFIAAHPDSHYTGGQANSVILDAGAGVDTVVYQGRATDYSVAHSGSGFSVTPDSFIFGTDSIANAENLLFDDRRPYAFSGNGALGAAAAVNDALGLRIIDAGGGLDTLYLRGTRLQYDVQAGVFGGVQGFSVTGNGVNEWVTNVERLGFSNGFLGLDIAGDTGMAYRIYQASFNRAPDTGGLGFWINAMDNGMGLEEVASNFIGSVEFQNTYGGLNNGQFVTQIYQNVLHRAPDPGGLAFWQGQLDNGIWTRAVVLTGFSESVENQANVIGVIADGAAYQL